MLYSFSSLFPLFAGDITVTHGWPGGGGRPSFGGVMWPGSPTIATVNVITSTGADTLSPFLSGGAQWKSYRPSYLEDTTSLPVDNTWTAQAG